MENDISEGFMDLVRGCGDRVDIHTKVCVEWKAGHENCKGCSSDLGCAKAVAMLGISMTPMMYEPKDYADYEKMQASIQAKLDKVLEAKTTEELHLVRW